MSMQHRNLILSGRALLQDEVELYRGCFAK
jgi:hypothetical protein